MRYIGDVHGKYCEYLKIIADVDESRQVGDFGMGFGSEGHDKDGHLFIAGNHDNPSLCRINKNWIPHGTLEDDCLYIGGAVSIDRYRRTEGVDWWPDEEISQMDTYRIMDSIGDKKINRIVTHECPQFILSMLGSHHCYDLPTLTRQFFNVLFENYRPELWVFGHHHVSFDKDVLGTRFVCLNELEYKDI